MSEITPNDLPPINEIDEFTTRIPELQTDTDVLAGTGGPANFQAQALANRTKYLKRVLDLVGQELTGINQAVSAAQQTADTAKQGADASMKKAANGSDIVNPAAFRANIGLSNAMLKGEFGWGGSATVIPSSENVLTYFSQPRASGIYSGLGNAGGPASPSGIFDSGKYEWILGYLDRYGTLKFTSYNQPFYSATNIWDNGTWRGWVLDWNGINLPSPATLGTAQAFTAEKVFSAGMRDERSTYGRLTSPIPVLVSTVAQLNNMRIGDVLFINCTGSLAALVPQTTGYFHIYCVGKSDFTSGAGSFIACQQGIANNMYAGSLSGGSSITWRRALYAGYNAVADSGGFWKTASPVINIYSDGSFTTTDEADGVNVERLSEGVYKITGCQGMHADAAWSGIDGGLSNPKCRNDKALLWNNYEVDEDGSITVYTFHRVHPNAMPFAQNRLTLDKQPFDVKKGHKLEETWPDQSPIDVPRGLFIQVRVNMPERIELKPTVMHSNVYCNSVSPAK
ncbi:hypothetical protein ACIPUF_01585 [Pectobacterium sp. CHL-2024]|uniref:phage tail fiber protein n=1 Tax=Pectobacterium sp. CHL-2024 TaxID=3377079 RepID=UPI0037F4FB3F